MSWRDHNQVERNRITRRIVLHRNGDPIHFDVEVDFQKLALALGAKAETNRSHVARSGYGAVKVTHVP